MAVLIRDAAASADGARCAEIYAPYVTDTVISFETVPPTPEDMAERIVESQKGFPWLVAEVDGHVVGYACGTRHHERAAYAWAVDVAIYLDLASRGQGIGTALYEELFARLKAQGYKTAIAGIALPNEASQAIHERFGFTSVGTYSKIGFKHGAWRDVEWLELVLAPQDESGEPPALPKPPT